MSQIFHRNSNIYSRLSIAALVLFGGALGAALAGLNWSDYNTGRNQFIDQPVQFSHKHHVGGMGIDCRYCHTSVEESAFANIPPTKTCMNCHSQIWATAPILEPVRASFRDGKPLQWTRVHDLPDFVYFNHSIHVKQGVGCATCHGRVDEMPLMRQEVDADDAVVHRLPPQPGEEPAPAGPGVQHGVGAAGRRSRPRRTAAQGIQHRQPRAVDELLDVSPVMQAAWDGGYRRTDS